jgi:alkyl hydroperoxide reductase subunit AhpC
MSERLVGKKAPNFKMTAVSGSGESFSKISLEDYKGKWLIMFFYPLDFTFVCPTEITGYSKRYDEFVKEGAEILAVSTDSEYSHQAWIKGELGKIKFSIASDFTKQTAKEYGVLVEEDGVALRGLFIIDPDGVVRYSVIHDLNIGRSVSETLRVLAALKSGGLCPIDWQPGDENL